MTLCIIPECDNEEVIRRPIGQQRHNLLPGGRTEAVHRAAVCTDHMTSPIPSGTYENGVDLVIRLVDWR